MSSSDSEDDCYGNIAQKLQSIKSKYTEKTETPVAVNTGPDTTKVETIEICDTIQNTENTPSEDPNVSVGGTDNDELTIDDIIAQNPITKKPGKRKATTPADISTSPRKTRSSKRKTVNSTKGRRDSTNETLNSDVLGENSAQNAVLSPPKALLAQRPVETTIAPVFARARGRGRGRRNRRGSNTLNRQTHSNISHNLYSNFVSYPTFSVGNTDEYPDFSDNQQLFASKPDNEVEFVDVEDPLEDNEELSVKVYWQSLEIFKFKIRRYQNLTQIFDYFAEKANVKYDKLLFTYNDRILKINDTPDSFNYNIAKFIDGGVVTHNVTNLLKENKKEINGIKLKFQCQNKKKPYETTVRPEEKLSLAMIKCAEHLETTLDKLKFYFDGDLISTKSTPQDLELEGGECIDVKLCS